MPGVDDGPRDLSEAVEMCAQSAAEGIEAIVATPHVLRGRWPVFSRRELELRIGELRDKVGNSPRLLLGSEYFFSHDISDALRSGSIVPLAGGRYVLFELPSNSIPPLFHQPIYAAQLEGWIPIVAHPERNTVFQENPEVLVELIERGVRTQITATSLTGAFGPQARRAAELFLRRRMVHFVASDAHNMTKRPPRLAEALQTLRELCEESVVQSLTEANPAAVLENRALPYDPEPQEVTAPGFFTRLRGFFGSR